MHLRLWLCHGLAVCVDVPPSRSNGESASLEWRDRHEALTPFFTERERRHAGCQHQLFFSQVEFCDNLIFRM
jgi:hypothetical protein